MRHSFEQSSMSVENTNETTENIVDSSEGIAEAENTTDDFEDCGISEESSAEIRPSQAEVSEDIDDDYEDCEAKAELVQEKKSEVSEDEDDDFEDCGIGETGEETEEAAEGDKTEEAAEEAAEVSEKVEPEEVPEESAETAEVSEKSAETVEIEEVEEEPGETEEVSEEVAELTETEESQEETDETVKEVGTEEVSEELNETVEEETAEAEKISEEPAETEEVPEDAAEAVEITEAEEVPEEAAEIEEDEAEIAEAEETEEVPDETQETEEVPAEVEETAEATETEEVPEEAAEIEEGAKIAEAEETEEVSDETQETEEVPAEVEETAEATETEEVPEEAAEIEEGAKIAEAEETEEVSDETQETEEVPAEVEETEEVTEAEESPKSLEEQREENEEKLSAAIKERDELSLEENEKFNDVLSKDAGTDEYKEALKEYNTLKDRREILDEEIGSYEQQKEILEKKALELRTAQIENGEKAVEDSRESLAWADELQKRYDEAYYAEKTDGKELNELQEENLSAIKELEKEKAAIKQAMDAKMAEISEYVSSNNLERYDTERDQYYQSMIADYISMRDSYQEVDYSVTKLNVNNIHISEMTGAEYEFREEVPKRSPVEAVNEGMDVPGETDYFIDETRAEAVLEQFDQNTWEQLTVREQKKAIDELADYNADLLGVEDKPQIIYYNIEDPTDFGGYSEELNAIYINEYNLGDAEETVDTISHEYRHKYQHERAERLENERDLEFKESFDNYIRPEDDFAAYQDQLVEADAREYAEVIKKKAAEISAARSIGETPEAEVQSQGQGADFRELNEGRGAVFDRAGAVEKTELPEDLDRKIEIRHKKEVFEAKELQELKDLAEPHYENGKKIAGHIESLNSYKEHHLLEGGHIEKVHDRSLEAADVITEYLEKNTDQSLYSANIDYKTLEVMALYHDTGMDGNIPESEYDIQKEKYNKTGKAKEKAFEDTFRDYHSLESAIHVLRDREQIESKGVNADEVAVGCLLHSKSCSGVHDLEDLSQWGDAIKRLQVRVSEYNEQHPEEQISFDSSFLLDEKGDFNQEKLSEMRTECLCLRVGDGNGHDELSRISQNGKVISFDLENYEFAESDTGWRDEITRADVRIDGQMLDNANDPSGFGRMYNLGEGNLKKMSMESGPDGQIVQVFEISHINSYPYCTQECIEERLKEFITAPSMVENYKPEIRFTGKCSKETRKNYVRFRRAMYRRYGIEIGGI